MSSCVCTSCLKDSTKCTCAWRNPFMKQNKSNKMNPPSKKPKPSCSRSPQNISKTDWYYEDPKSIEIIHEVRLKDGSYFRTDSIKIKKRMLEASLKRMNGVK